MAAPSTPQDPDSRRGRQALQELVIHRNQQAHPDRDQRLVVAIVHVVLIQSLSFSTYLPTVADMAKVLNKVHMYYGHVRSDVPGWLKKILMAMAQEAGVQEGSHYEGELRLNKNGTPRLNDEHNKSITIKQAGVFVLFGLFFPDRVQFMNYLWDLMTGMYQAYVDMKNAFEMHKREIEAARFQRTEGQQLFLGKASECLGVGTEEANLATLQCGQKDGRKPYFNGMTPTKALQAHGLLHPDQKTGCVHEIMSAHGLICDQHRLSTYAQVLRIKQAEFEALQSTKEKKRLMNDTLRETTEFLTERQVYKIPGATEKQQTAAFFDEGLLAQRPRKRLRN